MKIIASCADNTWASGLNDHKKPAAARRVAAFSMVSLALCAALLAGCSNMGGGSAGPQYRCEHGINFSARFADDTAVLSGTGGQDVLYRDAGGQGPQQSVYSNPRMRAEFGLGASGKEAILRYPLLPLVARCARE